MLASQASLQETLTSAHQVARERTLLVSTLMLLCEPRTFLKVDSREGVSKEPFRDLARRELPGTRCIFLTASSVVQYSGLRPKQSRAIDGSQKPESRNEALGGFDLIHLGWDSPLLANGQILDLLTPQIADSSVLLIESIHNSSVKGPEHGAHGTGLTVLKERGFTVEPVGGALFCFHPEHAPPGLLAVLDNVPGVDGSPSLGPVFELCESVFSTTNTGIFQEVALRVPIKTPVTEMVLSWDDELASKTIGAEGWNAGFGLPHFETNQTSIREVELERLLLDAQRAMRDSIGQVEIVKNRFPIKFALKIGNLLSAVRGRPQNKPSRRLEAVWLMLKEHI